MKNQRTVFLLCALACLAWLQGCVVKGYGYQLQDERTFRLEYNRHVAEVAGIDTILCNNAIGSVQVYFDDMVWDNLSQAQKKGAADCLNSRRHLMVTQMPDSLRSKIREITARVYYDEMKLKIGWVAVNCLACEVQEVIREYRLVKKDSVLVPTALSEEEMWR